MRLRFLFFILVFFMIVGTILSCYKNNSINLSSNMFMADGVSSGVISIFGNTNEIQGPFGDLKSINIINKIKIERGHWEIYFRSTKNSGEVFFTDKNGKKYQISFVPDLNDGDDDGFTDGSELWGETDRESFLNWFLKIAISQYLKRSASWNTSQRDCSGLIRYCYREALKVHDDNWYKSTGIRIDDSIPDVKCFNYPDIPIIKKNIFAVIKMYSKKDLIVQNGTRNLYFSNFADAENLLKKNTHFVSKDISFAKGGDILFFMYQRDGVVNYHSMIYIGVMNKKKYLIYHTGTKNRLKLVPLSYLTGSIAFRPVKWNINFLGVYRFNIME